jgi:methionine-rich copper-binding protein CopC
MRYFLILCVCVLPVFTAADAFAHAQVKSSMPAAGEVLAASPDAITITFSEELRPQESYIKLFGNTKKQLNNLPVTMRDDKETLSAPLPKLASGIYTVKWKAVCLCTDHHATYGSYRFTVK